MSSAVLSYIDSTPSGLRVLALLTILIGVHLAVLLVRRLGDSLMTSYFGVQFAKTRTVTGLATSLVVFVLYFSGFGLIMQEFGVSLQAYFTSASVMGLAIGFGLQGFVQDIVMGLTLVFSDIVDVGDMVEISGQTGIVQKVGMRFTVLENPFGAIVYLPNRTIVNVLHYPRGYLRGLADITLPSDRALAHVIQQQVSEYAASLFDQFPGILITKPSIEGRIKTQSGKAFLRVKFRIWPGRGGPIETVFKQELVQALKNLDEKYEDWMVTVNYEVEQKAITLSPANFQRKPLRRS